MFQQLYDLIKAV